MNRREALEKLLAGHKVVSYFGQEYELTKHGIQSQTDFLPMSNSCTYSDAGLPENPHEHGTADWARFEVEHGRSVRSPSGLLIVDEEWFSDLFAKGWEVVK